MKVTYLDKDRLLANDAIDWKSDLNLHTGEVSDYPIRGEHYCMQFKLNRTRKELKGSIHKLSNEIRNDGPHNYNGFNYDDLVNIIEYLEKTFLINPSKTIVENLEYGLNILLWKSPQQLIQENIIVWDAAAPSKNFTYDKNKGKFIQWNKSQYFIKCYDKGKQYNRSNYILRWEKKVIKNEYLNKFGIKHLSDLLDKTCLEALRDDLLSEVDKLVIVDALAPQFKFNAAEQKVWDKGTNPKHWENLSGSNRHKKFRLTKNFNHLLHKFNLDTFGKEIRSRLKTKWDDLLQCNVLTDMLEPESATVLPVYISSYRSIPTRRKCMVTGLDISNQVDESKFIWENTIKNLNRSNVSAFNKLCRKYLKLNNRSYSSIDEMCYYIAHNIRNEYWNKTYRVRTATTRYKDSLFPL